MIKRILALVLSLLLVSSVFMVIPAFAATQSQTNLLTDLGIIEEEPASLIVKKSYTRSDFAKALSLLDSVEARKPDESVDVSQFAQDIAKDSNLAAICEMIENKIMSTENNLFRPNAAVTKNEAAKALVKILSYEPMVSKNGNTAAAYNMMATKLGIFKGVSIKDESALSHDEVGKLLYNAMRVPFYMADEIVQPLNRCFFDSWELTEYRGTVLANVNFGIGVTRVSPGKVNIDGTVYRTSIMIEDIFVGATVTYYTQLIDGVEVIISVTADSGMESVSMNAGDIEQVKRTSKGFTVVYDEDKEIFVPQSAFMIVNNKTMSPTNALFNAFKNGTVTFVDTNGDGTYDVGHMTLLLWGIVEGVSSNNDALVVRVGGSFLKVELDKAEVVETYIGKKIAGVSELQVGMAVGIGCDTYSILDGNVTFDFANAKTVKIYGSNRMETGYVESVSGNEVSINEMNFALSDAYRQFVTAGYIVPIEPGAGVILYFDNYGEIVYYKTDPNAVNMQYGYLIDAAVDNKAMSSELLFKIMDSTGAINIYSTKNESFILDNVKVDVQKNSLIYTVSGTGVDFSKRQLVKFLASENILRKLDSSALRDGYEMKNGSLSQSNTFDFYAASQSSSKISAGNIERRFLVPSKCIVFVDGEYKDAVTPNEKRFSVRTSSVFGAGKYNIATFDANEMNEVPCIVYYTKYGKTEVVGGTESRDSLSYNEYRCFVVEEISRSVDKNGEPAWDLTVAGNNTKTTITAPVADLQLYEALNNTTSWTGDDRLTVFSREPEQLDTVVGKGDLIRYTTEIDGTVNYIEKWFDFSDNQDTVYGVPNKDGTQHGFVNIEKCVGTSIMYTEDATDTLLTNPDLTTYVFKKRETEYNLVPVYNVKKGTASLYNYSDLPAIAKGDKVKAFVRFYDSTYIFDYIFYLYE